MMRARWSLGPALVMLLAARAEPAPEPGVLAGTVVDEKGAPIAAWMEIRDAAGRMPESHLRAQVAAADGRFRFDGLAAGRYRFFVVASGCAWQRTELRPPGGEEIRIVLAPERRLEGRVLGPDGKPLAGAEVKVPIPEAAIVPRGTTAADGRFSVGALTDSPADVVALARDRGTTGRAKWVVRRPGTRATDGPIDLVLGKGLTIEGRVEENGSVPGGRYGVVAIPRARSASEVSTQRHRDWPSAWTAADGTFRIEGLDSGKWTLVRWFGDGGVGRTGPGPKELEGGDAVDAGAKDVVVRLVRPK